MCAERVEDRILGAVGRADDADLHCAEYSMKRRKKNRRRVSAVFVKNNWLLFPNEG